MDNFTVYKTDTGEVMYSGTSDLPELFATTGLSVLVGTAHPIGGWINSSGTYTAQPPRPSVNHTFDFAVGAWVDARTLQQRKDAKRAEMLVARTAAINSPVSTIHGTFAGDPESRQNIVNGVLMLDVLDRRGPPASIDFTLADDTVVTLNVGQMVTVGVALAQQVQAAHARYRAVHAQINSATLATIDTILWEP